ncbi:hypothetical protein AB395_0000351 [Sinorhizobium fredii CCBAU 45436]|nr:hypothetical protein AB395_0000351 [Sinorhizobium fredii CCBAU 45436]
MRESADMAHPVPESSDPLVFILSSAYSGNVSKRRVSL